MDLMRWGLVPFWAKDIKVSFSNINAKAEGIEGRPAFREAFQRRRCLVPVDNFYEWKKTATPNKLCAELHNRMPVVLSPDVWSEWLGEELADPACLKALLAPYPAEEMICWPVSTLVGNVKNNDPSLIEPVALAA